MSVDPQSFTLAEFIVWEERQRRKHEFRNGAVYAMAGASDAHNQIVSNLISIIRPALRGGSCRVYANDMMLVTEFPGARYPDVLVTCDERDSKDRRIKRYPKLIIEVLSESTAAVDAADKLDEYQTIDALEAYVLVDSRKASIRIYRRNSAGAMETGPSVVVGPFDLASLGLIVDVAEIYEDVDLTQASRSEVEPSR